MRRKKAEVEAKKTEAMADASESPVTSCSQRETGQQAARATQNADASRGCGNERAPRPEVASCPLTETAAASGDASVARSGTATRKKPQPRVLPRGADFNPLLAMEDERRSRLFVYMRECPYRDSTRQLLRDWEVPEVSDAQLEEFFSEEAIHHWEVRTARAATEAEALIRLAESSVPKFSAGILAALGQEAFRQIVSEQMDPGSMGRIATLFMKARADDRTDRMQELRREQVRLSITDGFEQAMEKLAAQVEDHPAAREAFAALREELARGARQEGSDGITEGRNGEEGE